MAEYPLIERQREMVRSLAGKTFKTPLAVSHAFGNRIIVIATDMEGKSVQFDWDNLSVGDFAQLVKCGFLQVAGRNKDGQPSSYHLDEYRISQAVANSFQIPEAQSTSTYNFAGAQFTGSNISIASQNITQAIQNAPALGQEFKDELAELFTQLYAALEQTPATSKQDADKVRRQTERLAEDLSDSEPDNAVIQITAEGLKKAAYNLIAVAPLVGTLVGKVLDIVQRLPA